jgi:hypothetical protein
VFKIVMCLKEGISGEELHQDTSNTPDITREAPAEIQDDFGSPVVASGDNRGVVFIIESSRAKVNEANLAIEEYAALSCLSRCGVRRGWNVAVVGKGLVGVANEKDVFGFKVGMDEVEVMKDWIELVRTWDEKGTRGLQATLVNSCRANC